MRCRVPVHDGGLVDRSLLGLANSYADIGRELARPGSRSDALDVVAGVAVARVPGVDWASIAESINGHFTTVAATDDRARGADEIQYEPGTGPCVDAILNETTFRTGDLGEDGRWPEFGRRAQYGYGVRSMLSYRLFIEDDARIAGLNL